MDTGNDQHPTDRHQLPPRLHRSLVWLAKQWPGRVAIRAAGQFVRLEVFDRSMTIAAQFFTSVLPILILLATWGAGSDWIAGVIDMPEESRVVIEDAVQGGGAAFGVAGTLVVLASATSLSRALIRAFAAIWDLSRPKTQLTSAWRWLAAVMVLAIALIVVRVASDSMQVLPPREVWPFLVSLALDTVIAMFIPWVLLAGAVRPRLLVPGALVFGLVMLSVRPATMAWLPHALEVSADRYGSLGVAFTYLTWLYVMSLCFLGTAILGQVIATDGGQLGTWIGKRKSPDTDSHRESDGNAATGS